MSDSIFVIRDSLRPMVASPIFGCLWRSSLQGTSHDSKPAKIEVIARRIGQTTGSLKSELPAVYESKGRTPVKLQGDGQISGRKSDASMIVALTPVWAMLGDRRFGVDWICDTLNRAKYSGLHPVKSK